MNNYDFSPMFRSSVGFDRMQRLLESATTRAGGSYPPYNIDTDNNDSYRISVAVAGFEMGELDIFVEDEVLSIAGTKKELKVSRTFVHHGIAGRNFELKFNLADHIKVNGANLENGMLLIDLEREVPEELKPRKIEIKPTSNKSFAEKAAQLMDSKNKAA